MKIILVTGSSGLIGSEVAAYFHKRGFLFFGTQGDTRWSQQRLEKNLTNFRHHELDIRPLSWMENNKKS